MTAARKVYQLSVIIQVKVRKLSERCESLERCDSHVGYV